MADDCGLSAARGCETPLLCRATHLRYHAAQTHGMPRSAAGGQLSHYAWKVRHGPGGWRGAVGRGGAMGRDKNQIWEFQMVFGTLVQTVVMYHSLIPRIVYGNASALEAVEGCEQEFQQEVANLQAESHETSPDEAKPVDEPGGELPDLDPNDILAEVTRMLEEKE